MELPLLKLKKDPEGVVAKIFEAVKKLFEAIKTIFTESPGLLGQIEEAVEASKELPSGAQSDASNAGLNPLETASAVKKVGTNCKYLAGFPNDLREFIKHIKELIDTLKSVFEGGEGEKKEGEEKNE